MGPGQCDDISGVEKYFWGSKMYLCLTAELQIFSEGVCGQKTQSSTQAEILCIKVTSTCFAEWNINFRVIFCTLLLHHLEKNKIMASFYTHFPNLAWHFELLWRPCLEFKTNFCGFEPCLETWLMMYLLQSTGKMR